MAQGDTGCHEDRLMAQCEQRLSSACPDDFLQKELVDLLEHARETRIWSRSSRRIGARANPPLCSRRFWLLRSERIPSRRATCTCHCEHGSVRYRMPRRAQPALCDRRSGLLRCERRPSRRVPCACRCDRRNQLFVDGSPDCCATSGCPRDECHCEAITFEKSDLCVRLVAGQGQPSRRYCRDQQHPRHV